MARSFSAQVGEHVSRYQRRMTAVRNQAVSDVIEEAQRPVAQGGRMRVDTGFLRNSLVTDADGSSAEGADSYTLVLAGATADAEITAAWTASYARAREFGARGQPPDFFARDAAQRWQEFVQRAADRFRS